MFDIKTERGTVEADVTFYTAQLYEAEFLSDMIQDLFGVQGNEDGAYILKDGELVGIDFTKVSWTCVMKAMWAAVKTADPSTPSYDQWMKEMSGANLWEVRLSLTQGVTDCFFRTEAAGEEAEEQEG